jgi:hypothetical protein
MWKRFFGSTTTPRPYITIVSGLPRSGTSMMMRMLEAGGMTAMVDHIRQPDADNPQGYYEFEPVKTLKTDASFLDHMPGKVIKIVSMLLYDLPSDKQYKILFMQRNMEEILASQKIMLQRTGTSSQKDDQEMERLFAQHLREVVAWLAQQENMQTLYVNYNAVLAAPKPYAQAVNRFLDKRLRVRQMVAAVEQSLYRNRATQG